MTKKVDWIKQTDLISGEGEVIKTISAEEVMKSFKEREEAREKQEQEEEEKKNSRKVICPVCKYTDRFDMFHNQITDDNGVCGPGFSSWVILEYNCCPECGVMFKDKAGGER